MSSRLRTTETRGGWQVLLPRRLSLRLRRRSKSPSKAACMSAAPTQAASAATKKKTKAKPITSIKRKRAPHPTRSFLSENHHSSSSNSLSESGSYKGNIDSVAQLSTLISSNETKHTSDHTLSRAQSSPSSAVVSSPSHSENGSVDAMRDSSPSPSILLGQSESKCAGLSYGSQMAAISHPSELDPPNSPSASQLPFLFSPLSPPDSSLQEIGIRRSAFRLVRGGSDLDMAGLRRLELNFSSNSSSSETGPVAKGGADPMPMELLSPLRSRADHASALSALPWGGTSLYAFSTSSMQTRSKQVFPCKTLPARPNAERPVVKLSVELLQTFNGINRKYYESRRRSQQPQTCRQRDPRSQAPPPLSRTGQDNPLQQAAAPQDKSYVSQNALQNHQRRHPEHDQPSQYSEVDLHITQQGRSWHVPDSFPDPPPRPQALDSGGQRACLPSPSHRAASPVPAMMDTGSGQIQQTSVLRKSYHRSPSPSHTIRKKTLSVSLHRDQPFEKEELQRRRRRQQGRLYPSNETQQQANDLSDISTLWLGGSHTFSTSTACQDKQDFGSVDNNTRLLGRQGNMSAKSSSRQSHGPARRSIHRHHLTSPYAHPSSRPTSTSATAVNLNSAFFNSFNSYSKNNRTASSISSNMISRDDADSNYMFRFGETLRDGRYTLWTLLGKGSFGRVVRGHDELTNEDVAIKIIKSKKSFFRQSKVEIQLLKTLNSTASDNHIVHMRDHFVFKGHQCIVFELLQLNLFELICRSNFAGLPLQLVNVFAQQILKTLTHLACRPVPIIHCDLKPENVLLIDAARTEIRVIDFGSACFQSQRMYSYIQSRFYRAPEVIFGLPYSYAIDTWSLACMLVELYVGRPLFGGSTELEQVVKHVELLGMPPDFMIERGTKTHQYFVKKIVGGRWEWQLKPQLQTRVRPFWSWECVFGSRYKRFDVHFENFLDLVVRMLRYDPETRIKPWVGLQHTFFADTNAYASNSPASSPDLFEQRQSTGQTHQRRSSANSATAKTLPTLPTSPPFPSPPTVHSLPVQNKSELLPQHRTK